MSDASQTPEPQGPGDSGEATLPEALMLVLFNPRNGTIAGEGLNLMYALGGAMITELAMQGHIELDQTKRKARRVGDGPASSLLRGAWNRVPEQNTGIRSLVIDIGTRSRETTLDRLIERGDINKEARRFLGFIPTHALVGGATGTRDRLLTPVRTALVDGVEPDSRTAALIALLSASNNLPAMHADIPWSGEIQTRGKKFERGDWGAKAASDLIMSSLVAQLASTAFATTVSALGRPD
jgi:hypothetical protein